MAPRGPRYGSSAQKKRILKAQGYTCGYCQGPLDIEGAALDHRVPWSSGGKTEDSNLLACHRAENRAKLNMDEETYRQIARNAI